MKELEFDLWLEFEHWEPNPTYDLEGDLFNMHIKLADGTLYALNVWTFKILERIRRQEIKTGSSLSGKYLIAPDLFVEKLDRELMEQVVKDLILTQTLKDEWLVHEQEEEL